MSSQLADDMTALFERYELKILGVVSSDPALEEKRNFDEWIACGYHGTMSYLETHARAKYEPRKLLEGCNSLVFTGLNYFQPREERQQSPQRCGFYPGIRFLVPVEPCEPRFRILGGCIHWCPQRKQ